MRERELHQYKDNDENNIVNDSDEEDIVVVKIVQDETWTLGVI